MSIWAFIDYENVSNFEHLDLSKYERMLVICGPQSKTLKIDQLPGQGFCRLEFLRLATQGRDNLDFHLAFHMGRLHQEAKQHVAFHIISKDHGYDGLIQHLNDLKRSCKRIEPTPPPPKLSQDALRIISLLKKCPEQNRPGSEVSLEKWIQNKFEKRKNPPKPENLIKKFQQAGVITVRNQKLNYSLEAGNLSRT